MTKIIKQKPTIEIDFDKLILKGTNKKELLRYLPRYVYKPIEIKSSISKELVLKIVELFISSFLKVFLRPRSGKTGTLERGEVEEVYKREAKTYNWKHHITTRLQDKEWRRKTAFAVQSYALEKKDKIKILDLCTGTGLTITEIVRILDFHGVEAEIIGIDYCRDMLDQVEKFLSPNIVVQFIQGDATNMREDTAPGLAVVADCSVDVATQMFGIGGIDKPLENFQEVLRVLKQEGRYILSDMHKPIFELPGELAIFPTWISLPVFENMCFEKIAIPLALKRLWAWRNTTALFYILRLVTLQDKGDKYFGFRLLHFEYTPERWWLSLPIMTVARTIVEKTEISREEAFRRNSILSVCKF